MDSTTRRDFLERAAGGLGGLALAALAGRPARAQEFVQRTVIDPVHPLRPRPPHFAAPAKHVIFLFQYGGPSQVDTFDHKPLLAKLQGRAVPESLKAQKDKVGGVFGHCKDALMGGPWEWARHGDSGLWVSSLLPHTARHADELCVLRSLTCDSSNHAPATYQMNTGIILQGKPSLGSWLTYGLGTENENLPGYVLLFQVAGLGGASNWGSAFLPAAFAGTRFRHEGAPVLNLRPPDELAAAQRSTLDSIQAFNRLHAAERPGRLDLEGRIASYELAYRMQAEALDVGDLAGESKETLEAYGVTSKEKNLASYGRMCLLARRLVEKGVRIVQTYSAFDKFGWDGHEKCHENHRQNARWTDQPTAALLADLKQRGLLDETLVIWGGEFGRTPMEQGGGGRNHNPYGFTMWLAGGGVRGGRSIGETDEIGLRAVERRHHVRDLHATILTAMGLRPEDLFFEHNGRPERLTGVAGIAKAIPGVLG